MATLFSSNILGFVRDRLMAQKLPAYLTDIYFNAFRLPDFIFTVFILGTVTTAFLPIFTKLQERSGQEAANRLASQVLANFAWLLLALTAILYLAMPNLAPLISPFAEPDRQLLLIQASRLLLLQPIIFSLSYLVGSILNARKYFLANSIAPLVYNLTIILFIYFGADRFGLAAIIYGVLAGAILHLAIQLPSLFASGFRLIWPVVTEAHSAGPLKEILALAWPRTLQLLLGQLVILYFARLAAGLPAGSVAALTYADNIQTVPTVIFGNSLALASFPYLAEAAVRIDVSLMKSRRLNPPQQEDSVAQFDF
ncbi:MAG: virulence factor, partial [Candidatus Berkelbacteria bacterium Gr01-1014_85]